MQAAQGTCTAAAATQLPCCRHRNPGAASAGVLHHLQLCWQALGQVQTASRPQPKPPAEQEVPVDGVEALELVKGITLLRGTCSSQLKYEVEYNLKRGSSDNSYLLQVRCTGCRLHA